MEICMFILFLFTNLMVVLVMKFTLESNYKYSNGMVLGVHIPSENANDEEVVCMVNTGKKHMNRFQMINGIISVVICLLNFWNIIIFVVALTIWLIIYLAGVEYMIISQHRKMYNYKIKNGWVIEAQKKKKYIDTNVLSQSGKTVISYKYHAIIIALETVCLIPFLFRTDKSYFSIAGVFFLCTVLVSLIAMIFHVYVNKSEKSVYSENTTVNQVINNEMKKYKGLGLVLLSAINAFDWGFLAIDVLISGVFYSVAMYVYGFIQFFSAAAFLILFVIANRRKKELLDIDDSPVYVDDDEYWKTGFYYNPNDKHVFVPNKLQSGNYAMNYATFGAKLCTAIVSIITAAAIAATVIVLIPFMNVRIDINMQEDNITISAAGYTSEINAKNIEKIELIDKLPTDSFSKTNGGATDEYLVGHFKGNTYGKCEMYIFEGYSPILEIKTNRGTIFVNSKNEGEIERVYEDLLKRIP